MGFGKGGVISGVFWTAQSMAVGGVDRMQGRMTFILVQAVQAQFHSRALQTLQPSRRAHSHVSVIYERLKMSRWKKNATSHGDTDIAVQDLS